MKWNTCAAGVLTRIGRRELGDIAILRLSRVDKQCLNVRRSSLVSSPQHTQRSKELGCLGSARPEACAGIPKSSIAKRTSMSQPRVSHTLGLMASVGSIERAFPSLSLKFLLNMGGTQGGQTRAR